jgi:predicted glycosyltransferase
VKVFFYVQHLLGIGHLKRAATLAHALREGGFDVALVSGGAPVAGTAVDIQLPPASAADISFKALLDEAGQPVDDAWKRDRAGELLDAWRASRADALLIELFPFGRRQMRFELLPLLEDATRLAPRPLVVCSVRDQIQSRPEREADTAALA